MAYQGLLHNAFGRASDYRKELRFLGDPDLVASLITEIQAWVRTTRDLIGREKDRVGIAFSGAYRRWHGVEPASGPPADVSHWAWTLRAAAIAALMLECGFAAILAMLTFNLPTAPAAIAGIVITIAVTLVFKGSWRLTASRDEERPRKAVDRLYRHLQIVFPVWLLALCGALFFGRSVREATEAMVFLFGGLMTILTVLSPVLAAILLTAAEIQGWARQHVGEWRFLEALEVKVRELDEYCGIVETRLAPGAGASAHTGEISGGRRTIAAAALLVLLVLLPVSASGSGHGELWVDKSKSTASAAVEKTMDEAFQMLHSTDIPEWKLYGFAADAFSASPVHTVHFPAMRKPECQTEAPRNELRVLFRGPAEANKKKMETACQTARDEALSRHTAEVEKSIREGRDQLWKHSPAGQSKTCLLDLIARLSEPSAEPPRAVLILTDGEETCQTGSRDALSAPRTQVTVIMAVAPVEKTKPGQSQRQRFLQIQKQWAQWAPWVHVIAPYQLGAGLFRDAVNGSPTAIASR